MIRQKLKAAYRLVNGKTWTLSDMKRNLDDTQQINREKLDEILFFLHKVKNATTVKTGEYEAITSLFTGSKIYIDTRDVSIAPHLIFNSVWEEGITEVFRKQLHDDTVFFDIGANFGYYSLLAGEKNKRGSIYLFEANPDLIPLITKSISVNGLTNRAMIVEKAVTNSSGDTLTLHRSENLWGGSTLHSPKELEKYRPIKDVIDKTFKVQSISIDDFTRDHKIKRVDFVKIDVEGLEDVVYSGMKKTIRDNPGITIFLEFTTGGAYKDEKGFFNQLANDFSRVQVANETTGHLTTITTLDELYEAATSELAMLLLKNPSAS